MKSLSINEAVQILREGGIVALPTETVYGLAIDILQPRALEKLYELKGRPENKAIPIAIRNPNDTLSWVKNVSPQAKKLMDAFWPGPLTLLFERHPAVPAELTAGSEKIGLRCANHPVIQDLILGLGHPIGLTSANLSGKEPAKTAAEVDSYFQGKIPILIDDDAIAGIASTIVDTTVEPMQIVRQGSISREEILHFVQA